MVVVVVAAVAEVEYEDRGVVAKLVREKAEEVYKRVVRGVVGCKALEAAVGACQSLPSRLLLMPGG